MGYNTTKTSCAGNKALRIKLYLSLTFGSVLLMLAVLSIICDPIMIVLKYMTRMDGNLMLEALKKEADSAHLEIFLFNITNSEAFANGDDEKLKVQEVGPFTYQERRTNEDVEIDYEAKVLRYTPRQKNTFLLQESIGDPKDYIVTLPNLAFLTMASKMSSYGYLAKIGLNMLTSRLKSNATITVSAHDFLWGYNEPLIQLGNQYLPGWISFEKLGLLDRLYDKKETIRMTVSSEDSERFMIKSANNVGGLQQWGFKSNETRNRCNSFTDAYEGICYPPDMTPARPIRLYRSVLCRLLDLEYHRTRSLWRGVRAFEYRVPQYAYDMYREDNQCLCNQGVCYDGVSDLAPCMYGLPMVLSHSHFLYTNITQVHNKIEGLNPNEERHGSEIVIETMLGMTLKTKFSVQVNILMNDVTFNSKIRRFSDMIVPVGYFRVIQPEVPDETIATLHLIHITCPNILLTIQVIFIAIGLLLLSQSARILYTNWTMARRKGIELHFQTKEIEATNKLITKS